MIFQSLGKVALVMVLLSVPVLAVNAQAQQTKVDIVGFTRVGDTFPEAAYPMSPAERNLYLKIQQYFDDAYAAGSTADPFYRRDATRNKVRSVKISKSGNIMINLDPTFLPNSEFTDDDPFFSQLRSHAGNLLVSASGNRPTVIFVYGGKLGKLGTSGTVVQPRKKSAQRSPIGPAVADLVVINTGHGWTYFPVEKKWRWQRPIVTGLTQLNIIEDTLTPQFGNKLSNFLMNRSSATIQFTRAIGSEGAITNPATNKLWSQMATRYWLEYKLPTRTDIWQVTKPDDDPNLLEYNRDIRARPYYANDLLATGLVSLHTNAVSDPSVAATVSGTEVYYYSDSDNGIPPRPEDVKLADSVVCYMKEIFKWDSDSRISARKVETRTLNHGETRLAMMPTLLVEVGYHTNPDDAVLLKDATFQVKAMNGVEKGWRMYREGKPCTPFNLSFISDVSGTHNTAIPIPLKYVGYPRFAVKAELLGTNCPAAFDCTKQTINFATSIPSPLAANFTCKTASATPTTNLIVDVQLIDVDGIKTFIQRPQVKCIKP